MLNELDGFTRIALTGKMRSGKSSIADIIQYDYGLTKRSFGDSLKYYADFLFANSDVYPVITEEYGAPCPFTGKRDIIKRKPRKLYQDFGQALRQLDENIWIRHVEQSIRLDTDRRSFKGIVIDDLRQPNEYEWARANGFTIIRVEASEDLRLKRAEQAGDSFNADDMAHDTEQHVDGFIVDYTIVNGGSLDDLRRQIDDIMSEIKAKGGR